MSAAWNSVRTGPSLDPPRRFSSPMPFRSVPCLFVLYQCSFCINDRSWVDGLGGHEVDRVPAARLDDALERGLSVEVVPLDVIADPAGRGHAHPGLRELPLDRLRLLVGLEHHRDRADPLAVLVEHALPGIVAGDRLDQLEVQVADHDLRPADVEVVDRLAVQRAVVHDDLAVRPEDLPRAPAERLVPGPHLHVQVADDERDLGYLIGPVLRWWYLP